MNIIERLSSPAGRRDQKPNIALGREIAKVRDQSALVQIRKLLTDESTKTDVRADLLKTLEAIGETAPDLIADFYPAVKPFLKHPKNFMIWRAMCVLAKISPYNREKVPGDLVEILEAMDSGSVITRDHGFSILTDLYFEKNLQSQITPLIEEQLLKAPDNQLGQYAEKWLKMISNKDENKLLKILEDRLPDLVNESHRKRISKIINKLNKKISK